MPLGAKEIHNLKKELTNLDTGYKNAQLWCSRAKIGYQDLLIEGVTPWERWDHVIDQIIQDKDKTTSLLKEVLVDYKENKNLLYFLSELTTKNEIRLNALAEAISQKKCVLFLGPEVLQVLNKGTIKSFNAHLCSILLKDLDEQYVYYDEKLKENLHYIAQCYSEMPNYLPGDVQRIAKKEFDQVVLDDSIQTNLLSSLAKIPVRLIINANPDFLLKAHIEQGTGNKVITACYDISNNDLVATSPALPIEENEVMLYNIFGNYEQKNSILYTESQLLEFINKVILGDPALNSTVKMELTQQDCYLFIGFDFEQWCFKVLFELLRLKKEKDKAISCNLNVSNISALNKEFFEEEFKVYFIDEDIKRFAANLLGRLNNNKQ